ncbi:facilitated trehalose transporter Tret1-like [Planococcus citri]|uniref:facilitated trehalose transporter Tret1-like n=1 Tax=Planococcus citri TaxID=170843 RepID=UPI0031FA2B73
MTKSTETWHQYLTLLIVAFDEFSIGMANGWTAPTLYSLINGEGEFTITPDEGSWIASLDHVGKILGAIFAAIALDIVGRKVLLTCSAFVFFAIWLITCAARSASILSLVRFLFGVFVGINDGTNSTYLAENGSPIIRNVFGCICIALYYVGMLFELVIATYLTFTQASVVNAFVTFLAFTSVIWIKEPVQYLLMKGKQIQAKRNFAWLHGEDVLDNIDDDDDAPWKTEFEKIKLNVLREKAKKSSLKKTISSAANYKSLFVMISIYCLAGCSGYIPTMVYASTIFPDTDTLKSGHFTVLLGIIQTLVAVPASLFVGRFNRRTVIMISFFIIAFSHIIISSLYYINSNIIQIPYFAWLVFILVTLFITVNAAAYPAIFLIRGELFPLSVKAIGTCLSIIGYSATSFLFTKIFFLLTFNYGIEVNFILYAVLSLTLVVFVHLFLPETRNKSLIEIQEVLEKSKLFV